MPLYRLLGDRRRERLPTCASAIFATNNLDRIGREFQGFVAQGYRYVKGGWGHDLATAFGRDARRDLAIASTVRDAIGPQTEMIVDVVALAGWDGVLPVFLGGDRLIAYPLWRGVAAAGRHRVGFLQIAADLCLAGNEDELWGRWWRGATNRLIQESRDPATAGMAWLGTSGFVPATDWDFARSAGLHVTVSPSWPTGEATRRRQAVGS